MAVTTKEEILEAVSQLNVLELTELVKLMEEKFGVSAAAPVAVAAVAGGAGAEAAAEEKTEFDVTLTNFGAKKLDVVKVMREVTGLGLIEAKKKVEEVPSAIKEAVSKEEAEEIKKKFEAAGATVEIK